MSYITLLLAPYDEHEMFFQRKERLFPYMAISGVPRGGSWGVKIPSPENSESPPKSCQTQTDCENC